MKDIFEDLRPRYLKDILAFPKIILWGAGFACDATIDLIGRDRIDGLFDSDPSKTGKVISGIEIEAPQDGFEKIYDGNTAVVISTNGFQYEIAEMLINKWNVKSGHIFCNSNSITEEWRYLPDEIFGARDKISQVYEMLEDKESKEYYMDFFKACITRNPLYYRSNPKSLRGSYFYETERGDFGIFKNDIIVDCGAYDGDTARLFMQLTDNKCKVYCIEPVRENYNALNDWVKKSKLGNIVPIHAGVGSFYHSEKVYSTEEKTTKGAVGSNRFGSDNPIVSDIKIITLDETINEKIDFIKMDIEGAEMDALEGASQVIKECKPRMLLSAYHKTTDMWNIPLYIKKIHSDYKIYLGHQPNAPYEPEFLYAK